MSKKKFTPMKVYTDTHAYRQAQDKAETKIKILNNAMVWCSEYINTDEIDREIFKDDFMAEFERLFIKKNKGIVNKELSIDKLLFLFQTFLVLLLLFLPLALGVELHTADLFELALVFQK